MRTRSASDAALAVVRLVIVSDACPAGFRSGIAGDGQREGKPEQVADKQDDGAMEYRERLASFRHGT
jgi:hypothetical protein